MTQHTPGPWHAQPEKLHGGKHHVVGRTPMVVREGQVIARMERSLNAKDEPCAEAEANARLIAAAPDLLAALQNIANTLGRATLDDCERHAFAAHLIARAAIAKATGEDKS